jgi:MFS family permease
VPIVLLLFAFLAAYVPFYAFSVYAVAFATSTGIGSASGVFALSIMGVANVGGKFLGGYVADRFHSVSVFAVSAAVAGSGLLMMSSCPSEPTLIAFSVVLGLGMGGVGALLSITLADFFGTANISALYGLTGLAYIVSGSVTPYLVGFSFDRLETFVPAFGIAGAIGVFAAVAIVVAHRLHAR